MGYGVQYIQRVNMSTAIVCMLNNTELRNQLDQGTNSLNFSSDAVNATNDLEDLSKCHFQVAEGAKIDAVINIQVKL